MKAYVNEFSFFGKSKPERKKDYEVPNKLGVLKENCIVQETNNSFSTNSNFIINEDDIYCNMGRFLKKSPKQVNICFVTGFSGSGKSTIAKKLAKYHKITYVELDYFSFRGVHRAFTEKDCKDSGHEIIWKYIKAKHLSPDFLVGKDKQHKAEWIKAVVKFVSWLETIPGNYVVEGVQCTYIIPANPKWLDYPIIFKGTSMINSLIRGIKRDEIIDLKDIRQSVIDIIDRIQWFYRSKSGFDNIRNSMITKDNHREVSTSVWDGDDEMVNELYEFSMEATTPPEIHTGKLDLRKMTFIHASHKPGEPPTENSCLILNGKKYRVRVETLIYNEDGHILAAKINKQTSMGTSYKVPGGSAERGKTLEQQAIAESQEEVRANVKDIHFTGIWYINEFDDSDDKRLGNETRLWLEKVGLKYDGFITILFIGKYAGKYTGRVKEVDKVDWIKDVKFYDPKELNLIKPHQLALQKMWFNIDRISK